MIIKPCVALLFCLSSISVFAADFISGHTRQPHFYDILCSNGKKITCWGDEVGRDNRYRWNCDSPITGSFYVDRSSCYISPLSNGVQGVQFNSEQLAREQLGEKVCKQL